MPSGVRFDDPWRLPVTNVVVDNAWRKRAACLGAPTDLWYPPRGSLPIEAKRICATCPVRAECLASALVEERGHEPIGYRGGLSPRQRARIASGRRQQSGSSLAYVPVRSRT